MKKRTFMAAIAAMALAVGLAACGGPSVMEQETLTEVSGIKVTAENAKSDQESYTEDAITVNDGDVLIVSPFLEKGSFHLTITSKDGSTTVYDEDVTGQILFQTGAQPDTYSVTVTPNNATGWMTVFATPAEEIQKQDVALEEALIDAGIDPSIITNGE